MPQLRTPRAKLVWTLLAIFILVALLPLAISHYRLIGINRDSLETLEKQYLTRSAVGTATEVESMLTSYEQQLQKIAGGVMMTVATGGSDPFVEEGTNAVVAGYIASDPHLLALRIVNRNGQGAAAQPSSLETGVIQEMDRGIREAVAGRTFVGGFQYLASLNQAGLVMAVPVAAMGGEPIGAVEALVSLRPIAERLREEGRGGVTAYVVDREGRVLMHSEPALAIQRPDFSRVKIVEEFRKAPVRLTQMYEDSTSGTPTEVLGTVAPVGRTGWGVVVQKQASTAFASVNRMLSATVFWIGLALLLAIVMAVVSASQIARPIRALAEKSREIAAGNYQQRVEISSRNEIGELAQNFNVMSSEIEKAVLKLRKAAEENHQLFINSIRMLAAAIDAKDPYTRGHSERVARYSIGIGKHLSLPDDEMRKLRISALLHDVGKIGIDDRILRKPSALSDEEFTIMKTHPEKGAIIMSGVAQLLGVIPGMKYHHERWDGGGYPEGLKDEQIPMQARIIAIADTFDAMTTNRPYQKAMELDYVVQKIAGLATSRFDPKVVAAFERAVRAGDIQVEEQIRGAA